MEENDTGPGCQRESKNWHHKDVVSAKLLLLQLEATLLSSGSTDPSRDPLLSKSNLPFENFKNFLAYYFFEISIVSPMDWGGFQRTWAGNQNKFLLDGTPKVRQHGAVIVEGRWTAQELSVLLARVRLTQGCFASSSTTVSSTVCQLQSGNSRVH